MTVSNNQRGDASVTSPVEVDTPWMDVLSCLDDPNYPLRTPLRDEEIAAAKICANPPPYRKD